MTIPTRQRDEQILHWLRLRDMGVSTYEIARREGLDRSSVSKPLRDVDVEYAKSEGAA